MREQLTALNRSFPRPDENGVFKTEEIPEHNSHFNQSITTDEQTACNDIFHVSSVIHTLPASFGSLQHEDRMNQFNVFTELLEGAFAICGVRRGHSFTSYQSYRDALALVDVDLTYSNKPYSAIKFYDPQTADPAVTINNINGPDADTTNQLSAASITQSSNVNNVMSSPDKLDLLLAGFFVRSSKQNNPDPPIPHKRKFRCVPVLASSSPCRRGSAEGINGEAADGMVPTTQAVAILSASPDPNEKSSYANLLLQLEGCSSVNRDKLPSIIDKERFFENTQKVNREMSYLKTDNSYCSIDLRGQNASLKTQRNAIAKIVGHVSNEKSNTSAKADDLSWGRKYEENGVVVRGKKSEDSHDSKNQDRGKQALCDIFQPERHYYHVELMGSNTVSNKDNSKTKHAYHCDDTTFQPRRFAEIDRDWMKLISHTGDDFESRNTDEELHLGENILESRMNMGTCQHSFFGCSTTPASAAETEDSDASSNDNDESHGKEAPNEVEKTRHMEMYTINGDVLDERECDGGKTMHMLPNLNDMNISDDAQQISLYSGISSSNSTNSRMCDMAEGSDDSDETQFIDGINYRDENDPFCERLVGCGTNCFSPHGEESGNGNRSISNYQLIEDVIERFLASRITFPSNGEHMHSVAI